MGKNLSVLSYLEGLISIENEKGIEYYQWLKTVGRFYTSADLEKIKLSKYYKHAKGIIKPKQCFNNSLTLSFLYEEFSYVEGYYVTEGLDLVIDHGFNIKDGLVYDFTSLIVGIPVITFFGVEIPEEVREDYLNSKLNGFQPLIKYYYHKLKKREK